MSSFAKQQFLGNFILCAFIYMQKLWNDKVENSPENIACFVLGKKQNVQAEAIYSFTKEPNIALWR